MDIKPKEPIKNDLYCTNTVNIVCPYCYGENRDKGLRVARKDFTEVRMKCSHCKKVFVATGAVLATYTTYRIDGKNIVDEWDD